MISATVVAISGSIAVLEQPTDLIWQMSVILNEWGHWLALLALLLLPGWRRSWVDATGAMIALVGIVLLLTPLAGAIRISGRLSHDLDRTFGTVNTHSLTDQPARPAPLVFVDLARGVRTKGVIVDEHVYNVVEGENLTLDLYRPAFTKGTKGTLPIVMVVHGGGWTGGNKRDLPDLNEYLASRGYVVASIGYRLAPRWPFPAAQDDVSSAIEYVRSLAHSHAVDPERIALIGRSAGAQIVLLTAYTTNNPSIKGVVSFYGPTALRWGYDNPAKMGVVDSSGILETYLGGPPSTHGAQYDAAEPGRFVSASTPPTLFIQGLRDEHVSPFHAEFVSARLIEKGVPNYVLRMPWATHGCDYVFSGPCGQISTYAVERFLAAVLHN